MRADATRTGLSPEFHLASFSTGIAGSFCLPAFPPPLLSQSEKSHRSKSRPSPAFSLTVASVALRSKLSSADTTGGSTSSSNVAPSFNSSRYSFTSPRLFDIASFVRETGTTSFAQTSPAMTHKTTTDPIASSADVSGNMGSNATGTSAEAAGVIKAMGKLLLLLLLLLPAVTCAADSSFFCMQPMVKGRTSRWRRRPAEEEVSTNLPLSALLVNANVGGDTILLRC
mmetsp:Transcript_11901/g.25760  ORF Transcript_11901/g.25760 Transcript_11901/m.25760 type:complete len:227 (+) Transcript_11901:134-814(+)